MDFERVFCVVFCRLKFAVSRRPDKHHVRTGEFDSDFKFGTNVNRKLRKEIAREIYDNSREVNKTSVKVMFFQLKCK